MNEKKQKKQKKKAHTGRTIGTVVFYVFLALMIIGALFIRVSGDGAPRSLGGYTGMIVLSGSMQSEIPEGSLVITKSVDPDSLQVGDDITYLVNSTTTVTHRIVSIEENYEETGQRAFQTQGIMNEKPDAVMVLAANVVGKVIWHSKIAGSIAKAIINNFPIILFAIVVIAVLVAVLCRINRKGEKSIGISDDKAGKQ